MSIIDYVNTNLNNDSLSYLFVNSSGNDTSNGSNGSNGSNAYNDYGVDKCLASDATASINEYNSDLITVKTGEICTIDTAIEYGIFDKAAYFDNTDNDFYNIDTLENNYVNNSCNYSLCYLDTNNSNVAYKNCALSSFNPWLTIDETNNYCMLPKSISMPSELSKNDSNIYEVIKPPNIARYKNKKDYCQDKWYDWFSIPNYHLGNRNVLIDGVCYLPCANGYIPIETIDNVMGSNIQSCMLKDKYSYGLYKGTFNYIPLSLVFLLGSTKESLLQVYTSNLDITKNSITDYDIDFEIYNNLHNDENTKDRIYESIKEDLRKSINDLMTLPFDHNNIIVPSKNIETISQNLTTKTNIIDAYNICERFYNLSTANNKISDIEAYANFKKALADINGFDINSYKFNKQLLILKKACNILFDGKSKYSTDYILYTINKDTDKIKKPIVFNISDEDVLLSVSPKESENGQSTIGLTNNDKVLALQQTTKIESKKIDEVDNVKLNIDESYLQQTELEKINPVLITKSIQDNVKNMLYMFLVSCIIILLLFIVILILQMLWTPLTSIINIIYMSFYEFVYIVKDLFKGQYTPESKDLEIAKLNRKYTSNKIINDYKRFRN